MSATYTGTVISEGIARVDVVLDVHGTHRSSVEDGRRWQILSAVFRRLDWKTIVTLQNTLACTMTTPEGDCADDYEDRVELWHDLADIHECIYAGKRDVCRKCKCMEGLHSSSFQICRIQPGLSHGPILLSNTFTR